MSVGAFIFYSALRWKRGVRRIVLVGAELMALTAPWLIMADRPIWRLLAAVAAVAVGAKLYDVHVGADWGSVQTSGRF